MSVQHRVTREGDEMVCSCGLRWCLDENDPHPVAPVAAAKQSVSRQAQIARSLRSRHGLKRGGR